MRASLVILWLDRRIFLFYVPFGEWYLNDGADLGCDVSSVFFIEIIVLRFSLYFGPSWEKERGEKRSASVNEVSGSRILLARLAVGFDCDNPRAICFPSPP